MKLFIASLGLFLSVTSFAKDNQPANWFTQCELQNDTNDIRGEATGREIGHFFRLWNINETLVYQAEVGVNTALIIHNNGKPIDAETLLYWLGSDFKPGSDVYFVAQVKTTPMTVQSFVPEKQNIKSEPEMYAFVTEGKYTFPTVQDAAGGISSTIKPKIPFAKNAFINCL